MQKTLVESTLAEIAKLGGCRFVSLTYRAKESGEVARHNLTLGLNAGNLYRKSKQILDKLPAESEAAKQAKKELSDSLSESLSKGIGNNSNYTLQGVRQNLFKGIWFHAETGELFLNGFSRNKIVLKQGIYKTVKSSEKTLAKNELRRHLPINRLRTFKIDCNNLNSIRVNGKELVLE